MSEEILFQSGKWSVTRRLISTPSKDWKASEVMAVELSRIPLWSAVAVAAALALMVRGLWTILYWHEVAIAVVVIAALLAAGSIGLLRGRSACCGCLSRPCAAARRGAAFMARCTS